MNLEVKSGDVFLCIGDSITDCGRRGEAAPLGNGYVRLFRDLLLAHHPERRITVINKGISGQTMVGLRDRWDDDVIYHRPDWLSILIGINDLHYVLNQRPTWEQVTPENYEKAYREALQRTRATLTCPIIMLEPFYISAAASDSARGRVLTMIKDYIDVVRRLSREFDTRLVPLHDLFQEQLRHRDADTLCPEPVHPNASGHLVIAANLLRAVQKTG